jgi:hypothetical protein
MSSRSNGHLDVHRSGLTAHFLVLAIVTSTVSTFTAYPRLFSENLSGEAIGRGSLGLAMANTLILVFSASIYTLHEQYDPRSDLLVLSMVVAGLSGLMSLWLEFAIANLRLRHTGSGQSQSDSNCDQSVISSQDS